MPDDKKKKRSGGLDQFLSEALGEDSLMGDDDPVSSGDGAPVSLDDFLSSALPDEAPVSEAPVSVDPQVPVDDPPKRRPLVYGPGVKFEASAEDHERVREGAKSAGGSFMQGLAQVPAGTLKSIAILGERVNEMLPGPLKDPDYEIEDRLLFNAGKAIEDYVRENFPEDPELQGKFIESTLPTAMGNMVGFLAGGAGGRLLKAGGRASSAALGSGVGAASSYEEATALEADKDDEVLHTLIGAGLGLTEAIPIARAMKRFDDAGRPIASGVKGGIEEFIQEFGQSTGSNISAKETGVDPDRSTFEGAGEGGAAGGITGFLMNAALAALGGKMRGGSAVDTDTSAPEATEAAPVTEATSETQAQDDTEALPTPAMTDDQRGDFELAMSLADETQINSLLESDRVTEEQREILQREVESRNIPESRKIEDSETTEAEIEADGTNVEESAPSVRSTPIGSLLGERVFFEGERGTLRQDAEGTVIIETPDRIHEVPGVNKDLRAPAGQFGIELDERSQFELTDGGLQIGEDSYAFREDPTESFNTNEDGDLVSMTLLRPDGQEVTIRDPELALDVALAKSNQDLSSLTPEQQTQVYDEIEMDIGEADPDITSEVLEVFQSIDDRVDAVSNQIDLGEEVAPDELSYAVDQTLEAIELAEAIENREVRESTLATLHNFWRQLDDVQAEVDGSESTEDTQGETTEGGSEESQPELFGQEGQVDEEIPQQAPDSVVEEEAPARADLEGVEREDQYIAAVANESQDPEEIAGAFLMAQTSRHFGDPGEEAIADFFRSDRVRTSSYDDFGDPNTRRDDRQIVMNYTQAEGPSIDDVSIRASEQSGLEVTPQDVVDFMHKFKGGLSRYEASLRSPHEKTLKKKFKSITGNDLTTDGARQYIQEQAPEFFGEDGSILPEVDGLLDEFMEAGELDYTALGEYLLTDAGRGFFTEFPGGLNDAQYERLQSEILEEATRPRETASDTEAQAVDEAGYGSQNTLVGRDQYEESKRKLGTSQLGANPFGNPEIWKAALDVAAFHVEAGARTFADFSKRVADDLGEWVRPHLRDLYDAAIGEAGVEGDIPGSRNIEESEEEGNLRRRFHQLGNIAYTPEAEGEFADMSIEDRKRVGRDRWNENRGRLVQRVSGGTKTSSSDLSAEEYQRAIRALNMLSNISSGEVGTALSGDGAATQPPAPEAQTSEDNSRTRERNFSKRFVEDERIDEVVRKQTGDRIYEQISNETTVEEVAGIVDGMSLETARLTVVDENTAMQPRVRVAMAELVILRTNEEIKAAEERGDETRAEDLRRQTVMVAEHIAEFGTRLGQGVQAFAIWSRLTPEATLLAQKRKMFEGEVKRKKRNHKFDRSVKKAVDDANDQAINKALDEQAKTLDKILREEIEKAAKPQEEESGRAPNPLARLRKMAHRIGAAMFESTDPSTDEGQEKLREGLMDIVRRVAREHYTVADQTGASLADKLIEALGISEDSANVVAEAVQTGFSRLVEGERKRILKHRLDTIGQVKLATRRDMMDKMFELANLGALSDSQYDALLNELYEIGDLTDEQRDTILEMTRAAQEAPDGSFMQAQRGADIVAYMAQQKGVPAWDLLMSYWYSNILSGLNTQGINIIGNGLNLLFYTLEIAATNNPRHLANFVKGVREGMKIGATEAKAAIRGETTRKFDRKFDHPGAFEIVFAENPSNWKEAAINAATLGRYVFRALRAMDAFFFHSAMEGRAHLVASRLAAENVEGDWKSIISNELHNTEADVADANAQAVKEFDDLGIDPTDRDMTRRVFEIIEQRRRPEIREESARFGSLATYTQPPEGMAGQIAKILHLAIDKMAIPTPIGKVTPLRFVQPFVTIVANVLSRSVDYTVFGIARGIKGSHLVGADNEEFSPMERQERIAAGVIGSTLMAIVWGMSDYYSDDDDPHFGIWAAGPDDYRKARQLRSQGWQPFTVKIGDTYVKYNETPLALPFAIMGSFADQKRYNSQFDKMAVSERAGELMTAMAESYMDVGFMEGIENLFLVLSGNRDASSLISNPASGFVPAVGLLRDISKIMDPSIRETDSLFGGMIKDVPIAKQHVGRHMLNALGEEIERDALQRTPFVSRFASMRTDDPVWRFLAEHNVFLSVPQRDQTIFASGLSRRERSIVEDIEADRQKRLGEMAAGVFDDEEYYQLVKLRGQKIRALIEESMEYNLFEGMSSAEIKSEVDGFAREALREAKLEILFNEE